MSKKENKTALPLKKGNILKKWKLVLITFMVFLLLLINMGYLFITEINPRNQINAYYENTLEEDLYPYGESSRNPKKDIDLKAKTKFQRFFRVIYVIEKENLSESLKQTGVQNDLVVADEITLQQKSLLGWEVVNYESAQIEVENDEERKKATSEFKNSHNLNTLSSGDRKILDDEMAKAKSIHEAEGIDGSLDQTGGIENNYELKRNSTGGEDLYSMTGELLLKNVVEVSSVLNGGIIIVVGSDKPEGNNGNLDEHHILYKIDSASGQKTILYDKGGESPTFVAKGEKVIYAVSNEIGVIDVVSLNRNIVMTFEEPEVPGDSYYHPTLIYTEGGNGVVAEIQTADYLSSRKVNLWSIGFDGSKEFIGEKKVV